MDNHDLDIIRQPADDCAHSSYNRVVKGQLEPLETVTLHQSKKNRR